jgi:NAD dependent epimerase/dehydratase
MMNKRVLVTGACGFIGSHLTEALLKKNYRVRALAFYNSFNNWGWLENIPGNPNLEIITGDIRDSSFCRKIVKDIDIVFHLAALIAIPYSYRAPESYIDTNVKGTLNVLQAALDQGNIRVIHTSTSEVYGTAKYIPIDEKHPKQPQSPYSASKIGADAIAMSYHSSYGLPVTVARPFNTYGPRQSARAVIPTIISQIAQGVKSIRLGDITPTRDFNYVEDICRGLIELANCEQAIGEEINIGSNSEISVGDTFELIKRLMNSDVIIQPESIRLRPERSEVFRLRCDNSRIRELTGYSPDYTLEEGLKKTIEWVTIPENLKKYKPGIYNM